MDDNACDEPCIVHSVLNLENEPYEVQEFFRTLELPPEGVLIMLDGKPLVTIVPLDDNT